MPINHELNIDFTPEYKEYLKELGEGKLSKYISCIPHKFPRQYPKTTIEEKTFPSSFDPRLTYMTPIKDQGPLNTCFAFASVAQLEALASKNTGVKRFFSEEHLRFYTSNKNDQLWFNIDPDEGRLFDYTAANFTNWTGPVYQSDAPYDPTPGVEWNDIQMDSTVQLHVTGTKEIANKVTSNDRDAIMQAITDYGSVYAFLNWAVACFNVTNSAYLYYEPIAIKPVLHGICICGWDDNFPLTYFNSSHRPSSNGAWLVKDSRGTSFGIQGYIWVSYEEIDISDVACFTGFRFAMDDQMLSLDTQPLDWKIYDTSDTYICNMYDLTNEYNEHRIISDIMINSSSIGSDYSIFIVPAPSGTPPAVSSLTNPVASGTYTYEGFITKTLTTPYTIPNSGKFAFIVKTSIGNDGLSSNNVEYTTRGFNGNLLMFKRPTRSYYSLGSTWQDNYLNSRFTNCGSWCIRPIFPNAYVTPWTPHVQGSVTHGIFTLGIARGLCVSMGRLKFIHVHVTVEAISGSPTGDLQITGCPYNPQYETPLNLGITSYMGVDFNQRYVFPLLESNGIIEFLSCGSGPEVAININTVYVDATLQLAGLFLIDTGL